MEQSDWCTICGKIRPVRNDGTLARHRMDYAAMLAHAAEVVTQIEAATGRWLPAEVAND